MNIKTRIASFIMLSFLMLVLSMPSVGFAYKEPILNPFDPKFKLVVCDGPAELAHRDKDGNYDPKLPIDPDFIPCNFEGLMIQAQFLINAMIMLGTLGAIISFTYAGFLYVKNGPKEKGKAKEIIKDVGIGYLMMLTAWFIIYTILDWFVANPGVRSLLGTP